MAAELDDNDDGTPVGSMEDEASCWLAVTGKDDRLLTTAAAELDDNNDEIPVWNMRDDTGCWLTVMGIDDGFT